MQGDLPRTMDPLKAFKFMLSPPLNSICARLALGVVIVGACLVLPNGLIAQSNLGSATGSGSRQFRHQTLQSLPYGQLNQATKEKIADVLEHPSIYRRLPMSSIQCDPEYFRFLVRYPEVIVNIWQLMGVTQMTTERTGPYMVKTDDGAGTISDLELIYGNENLHIFYGVGTYEGPVIRRKLTGRCVLVLKSKHDMDRLGQPQATSELDIFLKVDNATLGLIAKSIQPIVGRTADHNFVESMKFVQRLNETTTNNGPGVQHMATRLQIDNDIREKFVQVAGRVYERAASKETNRVRTNVSPANAAQSNWMTLPVTQPAPTGYRSLSPAKTHVPAPRQYPNQNLSPNRNWPRSSQNNVPPIVPADSGLGGKAEISISRSNSGGGRRVASRPNGHQAPQYSVLDWR